MTILQGTIADQSVCEAAGPGQIVLVLQGGGALGAYQGGVYEALHEAGIKPDWIIGTSIGAINASLIAGNKAQERLPKLQEFWRRVRRKPTLGLPFPWPELHEPISSWITLINGVPGLFESEIRSRFLGRISLWARSRLVFIQRRRSKPRSRSSSISRFSTTVRPGSRSVQQMCAPAKCTISTPARCHLR